MSSCAHHTVFLLAVRGRVAASRAFCDSKKPILTAACGQKRRRPDEAWRTVLSHHHQTIRSMAATSSSTKKSNHSSSTAWRGKQLVQTTYRRRIPTHCPVTPAEAFRIPLTVTDIHLRLEQLPFCYYFDETLVQEQLEESLAQTLRQFPQMGGRICKDSYLAILCDPSDTVQLSFGTMQKDISIEEWQQRSYGHVHFASSGKKGEQRHPILLPLFDPLFDTSNDDQQGDLSDKTLSDTATTLDSSALVTIRVTYFPKEGGTAIGVNFNHALGDTATCVNFVREWGRTMRRIQQSVGSSGRPRDAPTEFPYYCTNRALASCSGIMTPDHAYMMGMHNSDMESDLGGEPLFRKESSVLLRDFVPQMFLDFMSLPNEQLIQEEVGVPSSTLLHVHSGSEKHHDHEYVRLAFPPELLKAMKLSGMSQFMPGSASTLASPFVSTNDMVTALGWLMKRVLSGQPSYNLSMVVNLRGQADVQKAMFGNGITNVIAQHASSVLFEGDSEVRNLENSNLSIISLDDINAAAFSVRQALIEGVQELPDRLMQSRIGNLAGNKGMTSGRSLSLSTYPTFSTTSWRQFPLSRVRFTEKSNLDSGGGAISGFHGHPAHPLPAGETYASVITPCIATNGIGCLYELLLPSHKADEARALHERISNMYLQEERVHLVR